MRPRWHDKRPQGGLQTAAPTSDGHRRLRYILELSYAVGRDSSRPHRGGGFPDPDCAAPADLRLPLASAFPRQAPAGACFDHSFMRTLPPPATHTSSSPCAFSKARNSCQQLDHSCRDPGSFDRPQAWASPLLPSGTHARWVASEMGWIFSALHTPRCSSKAQCGTRPPLQRRRRRRPHLQQN